MGTALLAAAEEDARELGAKGLAAWGWPCPFSCGPRGFKKHGYKKADSSACKSSLEAVHRGRGAAPVDPE